MPRYRHVCFFNNAVNLTFVWAGNLLEFFGRSVLEQNPQISRQSRVAETRNKLQYLGEDVSSCSESMSKFSEPFPRSSWQPEGLKCIPFQSLRTRWLCRELFGQIQEIGNDISFGDNFGPFFSVTVWPCLLGCYRKFCSTHPRPVNTIRNRLLNNFVLFPRLPEFLGGVGFAVWQQTFPRAAEKRKST